MWVHWYQHRFFVVVAPSTYIKISHIFIYIASFVKMRCIDSLSSIYVTFSCKGNFKTASLISMFKFRVHFNYWLKTFTWNSPALVHKIFAKLQLSAECGNFCTAPTLDVYSGPDSLMTQGGSQSTFVRGSSFMRNTQQSGKNSKQGSLLCLSNKFSAIAANYCQEQNNAAVKGPGGAVGPTENPVALRRWLMTGPESVRITAEFENASSSPNENRYHEQQSPEKKRNISGPSQNWLKMLGTFIEKNQDLLVLDFKAIMDDLVEDRVWMVELLGTEQ